MELTLRQRYELYRLTLLHYFHLNYYDFVIYYINVIWRFFNIM